jgi:RNA polymerase sigma-70 factor (ECF subfamily)
VLLRLVANHDLEALGDLYDRHAPSMWRAVERILGDRTDAGDVVHGVFLKLPTIARRYDGRANARSWLIGIAVRTALRHRRGVQRFVRMLAALAHTVTADRDSGPEARVTSIQELTRFDAALRKLSAKKRAVFVLVELEGMTAEEAATMMQIPSATARTRLHHARLELRDALRRGQN